MTRRTCGKRKLNDLKFKIKKKQKIELVHDTCINDSVKENDIIIFKINLKHKEYNLNNNLNYY